MFDIVKFNKPAETKAQCIWCKTKSALQLTNIFHDGFMPPLCFYFLLLPHFVLIDSFNLMHKKKHNSNLRVNFPLNIRMFDASDRKQNPSLFDTSLEENALINFLWIKNYIFSHHRTTRHYVASAGEFWFSCFKVKASTMSCVRISFEIYFEYCHARTQEVAFSTNKPANI